MSVAMKMCVPPAIRRAFEVHFGLVMALIVELGPVLYFPGPRNVTQRTIRQDVDTVPFAPARYHRHLPETQDSIVC